MSDKIYIFDTTLRDGEQSPGATMNTSEKIRLAKQLERLGVDVIEAGFPIASSGDFQAVEKIALNARGVQVSGLARANPKDIETAWEAIKKGEAPRIHTFIATSPIHMEQKLRMPPEKVLEAAREAVKLAKKFTSNVQFSAEDAGRSDIDFLCRVTEEVIRVGAVGPEAVTFMAVCPDCIELGWNSILYELESHSTVAKRAMQSIVLDHSSHYGHEVDIIGMKPNIHLLEEGMTH